MRRIKSIGTVTLTRSLYYSNEYISQGVSAVSERTIDGGVIVWEQNNKITTNDVIIESMVNYPITEQELIDLQVMADNSLGTDYAVVFTDGSSFNCRFKHEDSPIDASPIYEGACYYTVTIKMAKV